MSSYTVCRKSVLGTKNRLPAEPGCLPLQNKTCFTALHSFSPPATLSLDPNLGENKFTCIHQTRPNNTIVREFNSYTANYSEMANTGLGVPVKLLHESLGHIVTVELKTGQLYRGKLAEGTFIFEHHRHT